MTARFGIQRVAVPGRPAAERLLYSLFGVLDPAHYLHFRYVERLLEDAPSRPFRILDAGCGRGDFSIYLAQRYPHAHVVGADLDLARVEHCERVRKAMGIENLTIVQADLSAMAEEQAYDIIVSVDVLEHIPEQRRTIEALGRALRPGGVLIIHIPTAREEPPPLARFLRDFQQWALEEHTADERTAAEVVQLLEECGMDVVAHRRTFARQTGELSVSLFNMFYRQTALNKALQAAVALPCRLLARLDLLGIGSPRYALAAAARRPFGPTAPAERV